MKNIFRSNRGYYRTYIVTPFFRVILCGQTIFGLRSASENARKTRSSGQTRRTIASWLLATTDTGIAMSRSITLETEIGTLLRGTGIRKTNRTSGVWVFSHIRRFRRRVLSFE